MNSEPLKDLRYMVAMFSQVPGIYESVVDVDNYKLMEEFPEHLIHETLEDRR